MRVLVALCGALLTLVVPLASAQEHDHHVGSGFIVSHDVPDDGRIYVGDIGHFGIVDLGKDDDVPDFHQQNHIRVIENGVVLFETTPDSGHDYDGVNTFDIVFPVPGTYSVQALDDADMPVAEFNGYVVPADGNVPVSLLFSGPSDASVGAPADFVVKIVGADGELVAHSDAIFEVRQIDLLPAPADTGLLGNERLVFRTHAHTHTDAMELSYAFPTVGSYVVRVTAFLSFPSANAMTFAPVSGELKVNVLPSLNGNVVNPSVPSLTPSQADQNLVVHGTSDAGFDLLGTYDPYTLVGPFTQQHLDVLVMNTTTKMPVPHVNFEATLTGPTGAVLFASKSLHEYDGILELVTQQPIPGIYKLDVTASRTPWKGSIEMLYTVAPPSVGTSAGVGPQIYTITGLDGFAAGTPTEITFFGHNLANVPFMHSEVDVQVLDADGELVLQTKLHTHDDGMFRWTATLPAAGDYTMRLSPFTLDTSLTPLFYGGSLLGTLDFPIKVAAGPGVPIGMYPDVADAPGDGSQSGVQAPGLGLGVLVAIAGFALLGRRRQA